MLASIRPHVDHQNLVQNAQRKEDLKPALMHALKNALPEINDALRGVAEAKKMQIDAQNLQQRANILGLEAQGLRQEAQGLRQEAQVLRQEAQVLDHEILVMREKENQLRQNVAANREAIQANMAKISQETQLLLTQMFLDIFKANKNIPVAEINRIFNEYLAKGDLTLESLQGEEVPRINSMDAVIQYLKANPNNVKVLDFRHFGNEIKPIEISKLANHLKGSSVKLMAINGTFQHNEDVKNSLDAAIAARNGGLKVQYFAPKN